MNKSYLTQRYEPLFGCKGGPYIVNHNPHCFTLRCASETCFYVVGCDRCLVGLAESAKSKTQICLLCKRRHERFAPIPPDETDYSWYLSVSVLIVFAMLLYSELLTK